tara:strand:- start:30330 stop:30644 length:315 start_codon:yes stop_codon:yes gene_type:complete
MEMTKTSNGSTEISAEDQVLNAHQFLKDFLARFDTAKRGGIHDFMEIALFNMINSAIKDIDFYLISGHKSVSPQEIMSIFTDACQKVIDGIKRNLEGMDRVNFR